MDKKSYQQLASLSGTEQAAFRESFLSELRNWFLTVELSADFVKDLTNKMSAEFGPDGSYGVFVRSDTNVEDLPGFTGAGLNLTCHMWWVSTISSHPYVKFGHRRSQSVPLVGDSYPGHLPGYL